MFGLLGPLGLVGLFGLVGLLKLLGLFGLFCVYVRVFQRILLRCIVSGHANLQQHGEESHKCSVQ